MNSYVFMSDSDSDLWFSIARERNIPIVRMPYSVDGQEYFDDNGEAGNNRAFFQRMRAGALPSTSLLPTDAYLDYFEPILKEQDLLFVAFSSAMSNTFLNIQEARNILLEKYPQRRFTIVDTMSISGPQSLLLLRAHDLYVQGKSMEEVERWILENRMNAQAYFTVDDLKYLRRGGRISGASAALGSMLDIKPILAMGRDGKVGPTQKVQGRKKALRTIVQCTKDNILDPQDQEILVLHADASEDAELLARLLREAIPDLKGVRVQILGPVIGSHCGPGTLASCFMGKERPQ